VLLSLLKGLTGAALLNVLFLSENMDTGGTQKEILGLCRELRKLGHHLWIASNGGSLIAEIRNAGIRHCALPYRSGRRGFLPLAVMSLPLCLYRTIRTIKLGRIDVVHAYTYLLPMTIASLACRICRVPLVITLNDGILEHQAMLSIVKSSGILEKADTVVFISAEIRNMTCDRRHNGDDRDRTIVIPNMVDLEEVDAAKDRTLAEPDSDSRCSSTILWVSRLTPDKIDAVVSVIKSAPAIRQRFPRARVIIVGHGLRHNQVLELAKEVNRRVGDRAVIVTGFVKDVLSVIWSSDVVVGMGKVAIEAMACAKPVVVVGHIVGRSGGNFGGLVTKENIRDHQSCNYSGRGSRLISTPNLVSGACTTLLANKEYRKMLGQFGREHVEQVHDSRKIAKQLEHVYACAVRGARQARMR